MRFIQKWKLAGAIKDNNVRHLKQLLDQGVDANFDFGGGETPLHLAADQRASKEVIALLIQRGAKVNALKKYQWAPIHDAAYRGNFDAVVELLKAGADPNLRTEEGKTAYGWAVARKAPEVAELLSPYMKKVVELAQEKNLAVPETAERPKGWTLLSPQQIARTETHEQLGYRLTDIFNFRARERVRIVTNLETKADQVASLSFDDITDKTQLEDARQELVRQGGNAPEQAVFNVLHKLPRPPIT
jgi:hypothetical protein